MGVSLCHPWKSRNGLSREQINCSAGCLFQPDVGRPNHLAPLGRFVGKELAEFVRRERKHGASQSREARLDVGIGQRRSDLLVEPLDDIEPTPDDAIVILPGLALAKSINSGTLLAATDGSTSRT